MGRSELLLSLIHEELGRSNSPYVNSGTPPTFIPYQGNPDHGIVVDEEDNILARKITLPDAERLYPGLKIEDSLSQTP